MSQILPIGSEIFAAARDYGARRVLVVLSQSSFLLFAFVFWGDMYLLLGKAIFLPSWFTVPLSIVSLLLVLVFVVLSTLFAYLQARLPKMVLRRLEDSSVNNEERKSIGKSFMNLIVLEKWSVLNTPFASSLIGRVLHILASYSVVTLFLCVSDSLSGIIRSIMDSISWIISVSLLSTLNLTVVLLVLFVLSIPYLARNSFFEQIAFSKENRYHIGNSIVVTMTVVSFLSLPVRFVLVLVHVLLAASTARPHWRFYQPFVLSSDVANIVQSSFRRIQGKECSITSVKYDIKTDMELVALRKKTEGYFGRLTGWSNGRYARP